MPTGSHLKADHKEFGPEVRLAVYITGEAAREKTARTIVQHTRDQLKDALEVLGYGLAAAE